jgi:hypothetical protein
MANNDGWISLDDWCTMHGERKNTVHKRVTDCAWERGVHYSAPDGGLGFVHQAKAELWMAQRGKLS